MSRLRSRRLHRMNMLCRDGRDRNLVLHVHSRETMTGSPLPKQYQTLEEIAQDIQGCTQCPLHQARTNTVPGEGNPKAKLVFVGENARVDRCGVRAHVPGHLNVSGSFCTFTYAK